MAEEIPKGKYYPELNLVVVTNHRHHVAAAQATNSIFEIDFNGSIVPLPATSPLYSTIDFHFSDEEGNIVCPHSDPRFVFACLLAQQCDHLEKHPDTIRHIKDYIIR